MRKQHWVLFAGSMVALWGLFLLLDACFPFRPQVAYAPLVLDRDGTVLHARLSADDKWRMYTELSEITPTLRQALLFKEDRFFYYHMGVNPLAMVRALASNWRSGRRTSGASTITMQVARLLDPQPRTYGNKLREMFRALQLEWHYSKDEILQLYLNLVPYGSNLEGVKSAALLYFGRSPNHLSLAQIATLTVVPNRPSSLRLDQPNDELLAVRNQWLRAFREANVFPVQAVADALAEPLNLRRRPTPRGVPHLARRLTQTHKRVPVVRTTIDRRVQAQVETLTETHIRHWKQRNVHNAAVMVVDNRTREVVAYLGSPDFEDGTHAGQVDGVRAVRSPGSTLKPLVYALAFDEGKVTPKRMLPDVPTDYDGYAPENFDRQFHGQVTAELALSHSLNLPAVQLLQEVSVPLLVQRLKQAGFATIARQQHYLGLSTVLGGCGTTLEELTALYAALADQGRYRPLRTLATAGDDTTTAAVVSPAASFVVTEILTQLERPDLPQREHHALRVPRIAWKTGTSYGRRDAWSIGYNERYTVGVWVGNFSGEGVRELTGADAATPLLFKLFNMLEPNGTERWFRAPAALGFRLVCAETGLVPGPACEHQVVDYFLPLVSEARVCDHWQEVRVSPDETLSYCPVCSPPAGYKRKRYRRLPAPVLAFQRAQGTAPEVVPPHNPACTRVWQADAPQIVSPVDGKEYVVERTEPAELMLQCQAEGDVKEVYWYVNDQFFKAASPTEPVFWQPDAGATDGRLKVSCSDDRGRNTDVWVRLSSW
ncbi:penicillin-binding protein 1C [Catalinimonas alkaloidigena]|nr:penicillin-binding protein 1C [Catalinimonas alkaloidigena]